ncbi:MAG: hypothetical protein IPN39_05175 [Chitinophagaceae bacterium]|nr:hypothetical protein [Chitinophagaceae bacterium]
MIILTRFYYLILIIVLFACQREIVFETNTAQGTLKSQLNGDCLPAAVSGMYKKDTALTINNYIEIQAHFVNAGSYTIYSDTLNGYYFRLKDNGSWDYKQSGLQVAGPQLQPVSIISLYVLKIVFAVFLLL